MHSRLLWFYGIAGAIIRLMIKKTNGAGVSEVLSIGKCM